MGIESLSIDDQAPMEHIGGNRTRETKTKKQKSVFTQKMDPVESAAEISLDFVMIRTWMK